MKLWKNPRLAAALCAVFRTRGSEKMVRAGMADSSFPFCGGA